MKERPILFSAPMVQAILAGGKSQTRRVVKIPGVMPRTSFTITSPDESMIQLDDGTFHYLSTGAMSGPYQCPYGRVGDQIWVKETWQAAIGWDNTKPREIARNSPIFFPADNTVTHADGWDEAEPKQYGKLRPSIFMPRWASRIQLEITGIRIERLQDCSDADAIEEGIDRTNTSIPGYAKARYEKLWESINGSGSW
ncbi:MAG: hypothetical protein JNJ51_09665, partial [Methylobacillus glycogenes]|nr:hypothetical protein [Methylobacillus glycogenes]